ncbi:MAG: ABC transporter ATP-binding protein [Clostridia bacterium]|nr:ABC transporter ATP-binding protein [Clostridia bacterium]
MEKKLEVKNLSVSFRTPLGKAQAVRGVSFELYAGETLAIVGESGSGKSVTSKAVMGILSGNAEVLSGEILFDGKDLLKIGEKEFSRLRGNKISMIFQDPMSSLNPIMRIGKQITEAMLLKNRAARRKDKSVPRLKKSEARRKAIALMEEVGIANAEKRFEQYPFEFSGGMRQRIVIAIALSANPEVLICDEPTTALDVSVQAQILKLINKLKRERNLSVVFITHDLGVVANVADRIAVMYAGKIVEYGESEEIFYEPKHPYTWALLSSTPDLETKERLETIPLSPPDMLFPPVGDAFAERNPYALEIDFEEQPPFFKVSETHYAATWLLHPLAPKVGIPEALAERMKRRKAKWTK